MNTLTVSIINLDQLRHGVIARHRFECKGGTIGSGQTSWQLDDPNQSVAPIHCEIRWIEGSFCVIDHCQRTYLNGSATSLGAHPPRRLLEGDQLRVGAYRLQVQYAQDPAATRSLEDMFYPDQGVLDRLIAEKTAASWPIEPSATQPATEICSAFEPPMGNDPLAALDAAAESEASPSNPLLRLIAGDRP